MAWNPDDCTWTPASTCFFDPLSIGALLAAGTTAGEATAVAAPLTAGALAAVPAGAVSAIPPAIAGGGILGTGAALGDVLTGASVASTIGGTAAQFAGSQQQADAARQQANYQAATLQAKAAADRVQANQQAAIAQRQALDEQRKTALVQSRLRAVAASGGGYATDPSTLTLTQGIAGQGEYNALSRLASGQTQEATLDYQSQLDALQAQRYRQAAGMAGTAGALTGAGTLFSGLGTLTSDLRRSQYLKYSGLDPSLATY